jgi:hypothetical protein
MRSEHVFAANDKVINRFMLCSLASKTMRGFVKPQMASPKVINEILEMIGNGKVYETPKLIVERVDRILPV